MFEFVVLGLGRSMANVEWCEGQVHSCLRLNSMCATVVAQQLCEQKRLATYRPSPAAKAAPREVRDSTIDIPRSRGLRRSNSALAGEHRRSHGGCRSSATWDPLAGHAFRGVGNITHKRQAFEA